MKESYRKGLANHPGPESCEGSAKRKAALEALTGVYGTYVSVAGQICRASDYRQTDRPPDPEMVEGGRDALRTQVL